MFAELMFVISKHGSGCVVYSTNLENILPQSLHKVTRNQMDFSEFFPVYPPNFREIVDNKFF